MTAREFDSAIVATVKDMVDTNTETFVTNVPVKAHDARSGIHISGQLTVAFSRAVGLFAHAMRSAELYNLAPLGGGGDAASAAETVAVTMLYSRDASSDKAVSGGGGSGLSCSTAVAADAVLVGAASSVAGGCS